MDHKQWFWKSLHGHFKVGNDSKIFLWRTHVYTFAYKLFGAFIRNTEKWKQCTNTCTCLYMWLLQYLYFIFIVANFADRTFMRFHARCKILHEDSYIASFFRTFLMMKQDSDLRKHNVSLLSYTSFHLQVQIFISVLTKACRKLQCYIINLPGNFTDLK